MYGRRKAGQAWVSYLTDLLCTFGLERSASAPHLFKLHEGSILLEAHIDDLHAAGEQDQLQQLATCLQQHVQVKSFNIFEHGQNGEYEHLRRRRRLTAEGCYLRPSPAYIERCAAACNLNAAGKAPTTPLEAGDRNDHDEEHEKLDEQGRKRYMAVVGSLLYIAHDRHDAAHAVRLCAKDLQAPTTRIEARVTRVVRYLLATKDDEVLLPAGSGIGCGLNSLVGYSAQ